MIEDPHDLSVCEFIYVKLTELCLNARQLWRDAAHGHVLKWPVTARQNLSVELDIVDEVRATQFLVTEILDGLLGLYYVSEHCFHFADSIMPALHLQTLNHPLLRVVRHRRLIKQPVSQQVRVRLNENIAAVQAAE